MTSNPSFAPRSTIYTEKRLNELCASSRRHSCYEGKHSIGQKPTAPCLKSVLLSTTYHGASVEDQVVRLRLRPKVELSRDLQVEVVGNVAGADDFGLFVHLSTRSNCANDVVQHCVLVAVLNAVSVQCLAQVQQILLQVGLNDPVLSLSLRRQVCVSLEHLALLGRDSRRCEECCSEECLVKKFHGGRKSNPFLR